jgi:hypothetical protein
MSKMAANQVLIQQMISETLIGLDIQEILDELEALDFEIVVDLTQVCK